MSDLYDTVQGYGPARRPTVEPPASQSWRSGLPPTLAALYRPTFPVYVLSRWGEWRGHVSGAARPCRRGQCGGTCYEVRWPGGYATWPCSEDVVAVDELTWRIVRGRP